jgi:hypothetical protein
LPARRVKRSRRVLPLFGLLSLVAVALAWLALNRTTPPQTTDASSGSAEDVPLRVAAGKQALAQGYFGLARDELAAAYKLRQRHAGALTRTETLELTRLTREAALLADVRHLSLPDLLRSAPDPGPQSQAEFERLFKGAAVIFDAVVEPAAGGAFLPIQTDRRKARVELTDLKVLKTVPLDQPRRLIFGARLDSLRLEPPGTIWSFRLDPDSGVLLTSPDLVTALQAGKPPDPAQLEILREQAAWTADLP